jgi:hypothetical protein
MPCNMKPKNFTKRVEEEIFDLFNKRVKNQRLYNSTSDFLHYLICLYNLLINTRVLNKRIILGNIYLENKYIIVIKVAKVKVTSLTK